MIVYVYAGPRCSGLIDKLYRGHVRCLRGNAYCARQSFGVRKFCKDRWHDLHPHLPCKTSPSSRCQAAGFCFDADCQREKDLLFLLSLFLPLVFAAVAFLFLRKPANEEDTFESKDGIVFQSPPGVQPERDKKGELAYRAISYTPWPVEEGSDGDRLRIDVGPLGKQEKKTFVFDRLLPQPSRILSVRLPRPMGVVFEEDSKSQRLIVCDLVEGSVAYQRAKVAKMDRAKQDRAVLAGDVLRACTCTNFVYQTTALFGVKAPDRTIVLYGADNQKWSKVINALKRGSSSDGDVTLVLERSG